MSIGWKLILAGFFEAGPKPGGGRGARTGPAARVRSPLRGEVVLRAVVSSNGSICVSNENEILTGYNSLARLGFYVEPTSAIVWSALTQTIHNLPDPVIVVLTGSGYKHE